MRRSLADHLRDFGGRPSAARRAEVDPRPALGELVPAAPSMRPGFGEEDLAAAAEEGFRKGRAEAFAEANALHSREVDALKAAQRDEAETLREQYEQDFATTLATRFDHVASTLAEAIGAQVAATLAPVLTEEVRRRIVARLADAIMQSMADGEAAEIRVSGPPGLHALLRQAFADRGVTFVFEEADELDLTVDFNGTLFATRLAEWTEALKEALA